MQNARLTTDVWGVGLLLEKGLERDEIKTVIRRLMVEKEGKEMRERAVGFKEKARLCLSVGGSSYQYLDQLTSHILVVQELLVEFTLMGFPQSLDRCRRNLSLPINLLDTIIYKQKTEIHNLDPLVRCYSVEWCTAI